MPAKAPLAGIRVLNFSMISAGAYGASVLDDFALAILAQSPQWLSIPFACTRLNSLTRAGNATLSPGSEIGRLNDAVSVRLREGRVTRVDPQRSFGKALLRLQLLIWSPENGHHEVCYFDLVEDE